jgi:hypothetical protein
MRLQRRRSIGRGSLPSLRPSDALGRDAAQSTPPQRAGQGSENPKKHFFAKYSSKSSARAGRNLEEPNGGSSMSPDPSDVSEHGTEGWRGSLSRRNFLRRGTFTAAAVAVAGSVPGLSTLVAGTAANAPTVEGGVDDAGDDAGALSEPLIAQVKDATTGEMSLFQGEREVVVRIPELARSLLSAARQ